MVCPRCGSANIQVLNIRHPSDNAETFVTTTTKIKGYGFCKGCLGSLILGPIGWLCGLCGMGKGRTTTVVSNRFTKNNTKYCCINCGNQFES